MSIYLAITDWNADFFGLLSILKPRRSADADKPAQRV